MFTIPVHLPPITLRAAMPIKAGRDLLLSGEIRIGGVKAHILTTMDFAEAQRQWERATSWASSHRTIPHQVGRARRTVPALDEVLRGEGQYDEAEGVFDDVANFMTKSPIGNIAKTALSFVPGVNIASNLAFGAAEMVNKARQGAGGPPPRVPAKPPPVAQVVKLAQQVRQEQNARRAAEGRKPLSVDDQALLRAAKAHELMLRARDGNGDAQRAIGRLRIAPYLPGGNAHLDHLALDAAQLLAGGYPADQIDDLSDLEASGDLEEAGDLDTVSGLVLPRTRRILTARALREAFEREPRRTRAGDVDEAGEVAEVRCGCQK
jgi:hypothetical protein